MAPNSPRLLVLGATLSAAIAALTLAIPLYVIRPFRPQGPHELALALHVRDLGPTLSVLCALVVLAILVWTWRSTRILAHILLVFCAIIAISVSALTRVNIFERMFHPYTSPAFGAAAEVPIDQDDKLLSVTIDSQTHAFPIRTMGYHHIVNDTLAGIPIAATYCTLCHTGMVYDRRLFIDGQLRTIYFTLAGINNGNALLRDNETGSIWQQSTGEAIFGELQGRHLTVIPSDELTFALLRTEWPEARVLKPDAANAAHYDPKDWEEHIAKTHAVIDTSSSDFDPHTLMFGIALGGQSKAFPIEQLLAAHLVEDHLGGQPLLLVVGPDNASIRVFTPQLPDQTDAMHFVLTPDTPGHLTDRETGSIWNFTGCAIYGTYLGKCLPRVEAHKDYWFDWLNHHPNTIVFRG
jgi:hypothetical protein